MAYQKITQENPCTKKIDPPGLFDTLKQKVGKLFWKEEMSDKANSHFPPIHIEKYRYKNLRDTQAKGHMIYKLV